VTEFGDPTTCTATYSSSVISYADQHNASWTAWAWYPTNPPCSFPSIITDWMGTPSMTGAVVKAALMGYSDPAADGKRDAGAVDAGSPAGDAAVPSSDAGDAGKPVGDAGEPVGDGGGSTGG
jgi:hypothetical protein